MENRLKNFLFPLLDRAADIFVAQNLKIKLIAGTLVLAAIFLLGSWALGWLDNFVWYLKQENFVRQVERDRRELQVVGEEIKPQQAVIDNLKLEDAVKTAEVKAQHEKHQESIRKTDEGRAETKKSLDNIRRIETRDYTNTPVADAERKRCLAFPQSQGC